MKEGIPLSSASRTRQKSKPAPPKQVHKNHGAYFVPGLQRGLSVLETIASARRPLGVSDIAKRLGLARSAVFRLTYTLHHMGFLDMSASSKEFALGPRVLNIGFAYLVSKDIIEVSRADMEQLRDETNVSVHLAIRDERQVLYLGCAQTRSGFLSNMNVGSRLPAHASPMGWLLLSSLSAEEIQALYQGVALEPLTDQTPLDVRALLARVSEAATKGYVVSRGIVEQGGSSISAPVFDGSGKVVAAIDISGPDSAFNLKVLEGLYAPAVVKAAGRISARLGHVANARTG